jgi:LacI family transcriptional regulator
LRYAGEQGFPTVVREYSGYKGLEISVGEIALFLEEHPDLTGIFITNCMAHRVAEAAKIRALKTGGRKTESPETRAERPPFILVGYDLIPKNRELLRDGAIDAIISQRPEEQGRQALLNLDRRIVLEQRIPSKVEIPLDVYLKENVPP